ncbi:hypothetical protein GCM10020254_35310 [Streptomyces goshikiensis]
MSVEPAGGVAQVRAEPAAQPRRLGALAGGAGQRGAVGGEVVAGEDPGQVPGAVVSV